MNSSNLKKILLFIIAIAIIVAVVFLYERVLIYEAEPETIYDEEEKLTEAIGQMIMVGFRGTEISEESNITKVIKDLKIGGVVLFDYDVPSKSFPRNIVNPEQTKKLIFDLQSYSLTPLLIAVDAEGGKINRLKSEYGFPEILSAKELGEIGDYEMTKNEALKLSQELKDLGFNINFAPVLDVDINPENPIIGGLGRSFSSDPQEVAKQAKVFIEAHNQNNIITAVKHFPGHGSSLEDSHLGMVDVTESYQEEELIPYQQLNQEGLLTAVMTAHIINRKIDQNFPATLSPLFLKDILREKIGFQGVILSDDMQMEAIASNYGLEEAIIRAINSGVDILLFANNSPAGFDEQLPYKVHQIINRAVKNGEISKERIFESSARIYELKRQLLSEEIKDAG